MYNEINTKKYMIIPVYDTVVLPAVDMQMKIYDLTENEKSRIKIDGNKAVLLPLKEDARPGEITAGSFYGLGVLADIRSVSQSKMGTILHATTLDKVSVSGISNVGEILEGACSIIPEEKDITAQGERELLDAMKGISGEIAAKFEGGDMAMRYIRAIDDINAFAVVLCQFMDMTLDEKYALLETNSLKERGLMTQEALKKFRGTIELRQDLKQRYDDTEGVAYKKAAIQKQLQLLQQELDDMDPETASEENEFKRKVEESGMPEEARKEVDRVLKRYLASQPNDPEKSTLENYLDFVTSLKWVPDETEPVDLKKARKILDRDHYGLSKVKDRIIQQLAVMTLKEDQSGSILLLVGAPGTGKTSMGRSIAEALGRKYVRVSLGGIRDEAEIRGHRRTYIGAMPGRIMDGIRRSGSMNPVVVLDEVDKLIQGGYQGDPASALLEVLDPEQNNTFTDHYMNIPYDLSNVLFICTANSWDTIPGPLLDRMEVISLSGYSPLDKMQIAKRHLLPRAMEDAGLNETQIHVTDGAIKRIVEEYTMEAGVRGLKKQLDILCRHTAADYVENGKKDSITVTAKEVPKYLGNKGIQHDRKLKNSPAGVVTGLAWTQIGGEILFIETRAMHGSGQVSLTGQLGDVMKESATISVSLVKSIFMNDKLDFKNTDIHIHVPSGAVPKDGPSAGITLLTALVSLVTGIPVSNELAMTGEVSLRGQVMPIGGLPEKLMAAQRSGIKKVLIPKANVRDLEDVPEEVRNSLEIVPVETIDEVIRHALGIKLPPYNNRPFNVSFGKDGQNIA